MVFNNVYCPCDIIAVVLVGYYPVLRDSSSKELRLVSDLYAKTNLVSLEGPVWKDQYGLFAL